MGGGKIMPVIHLPKEHTFFPDELRKQAEQLPALATGDHLTREEFERRSQAMPHVKKAELLEGVVYMPSPVYRSHAWAHGQIITWLGVYCAATPNVRLYDNASVRLDMDNEVQPDALLRIESAADRPLLPVEKDDYIEGAPELIVEVAASSASYDLHEKLRVYRRNQVQEYLVWQLYENQLTWWQLQAGKYAPLLPDADGIICSQVLPGLHLLVEALVAGNLAEVLAVLQRGLSKEEHAAFAQGFAGKEGV
jgi:Uma2 family endonuclease